MTLLVTLILKKHKATRCQVNGPMIKTLIWVLCGRMLLRGIILWKENRREHIPRCPYHVQYVGWFPGPGGKYYAHHIL